MIKQRVLDFVTGIETYLRQIEQMKATFAEDILPHKEAISACYAKAAAEGIDPRALRTAIRVRVIERGIAERSSGAAYEQIRLHLGDLAGTPLGQYAETKLLADNGPKKRRGRPPKIEMEKVPTVAPHTYASDMG